MSNKGNIDVELLLKTDAFSKGITTAIKMLDQLHKQGQKLGVFPQMDMKESIKNVQDLNKENDQFQKKTADASQTTKKFEGDVRDAGRGLAEQKKEMSGARTESENFVVTLRDVGLAIDGIKQIKGVFDNFKREFVDAGLTTKVLRSYWKGTEEDLRLLRKATSDNISDGGLIKLSNYAEDLGMKLKEQSLFFHLADVAADKYGITIEQAFEKVIQATEGSARGVSALGIEKTKFQQRVRQLVEEYGKLNPMYDENNKLIKTTETNLDAEEIKRLRMQAILELTGVTMEHVTNAQKDSVDELLQFSTAADNAKDNIGRLVGEGLISLLKTLGLTKEATRDTTGYIIAMGGAMADWLPVIAMLKIAFPALGTKIAASIGVGSGAWLAIAGLTAKLTALLALAYYTSEYINSVSTGKIETKGSDRYGTGDHGLDNVMKGLGPKDTPLGGIVDQPQPPKVNDSTKPPAPKPPGGGSKGPGNVTKVEEIKQILTLAEMERKKLAEVEAQLEVNAGNTGAMNELLLQKEKILNRIHYLETGDDIEKRQANFEKFVNDVQRNLEVRSEERAKQEIEAAMELAKLRAENIENEWQQKKELIKLEWEETEKEINDRLLSDDTKEKLLKEVTQRFTKELELLDKEMHESMVDNLSKTANIIRGIGSSLGFAADSFVGVITNGLSDALNMIGDIISLIKLVGQISTGGGIFSSIFSALGFSEGGIVPGRGSGDTVPAMLTPGELVIKQKRVQELTQAYGPGFAKWLNGGSGYAMPGNLLNAGSNHITVQGNDYLPEMRLRNHDILVAWRKAAKTDLRRGGLGGSVE